jgi:lipoate-protein ligase B
MSARWAGWLVQLGRVPYGEAWELQRRLVAQRRAEAIPDTLVLLEHPPTYTVGRSGSLANVLLDAAARERAGIALYEVDRGGDATYHGPGQVVGYPIVDLRRRGGDVHAHLRAIEELLIRALADFGVAGERDGRYTGVWVGGAKVAAIGVKVSAGVASHGFALNVDPDFGHWAGIVPCGIRDRGVTSLARLLGERPADGSVRLALARHAADAFGLEWAPAPADGAAPGGALSPTLSQGERGR